MTFPGFDYIDASWEPFLADPLGATFKGAVLYTSGYEFAAKQTNGVEHFIDKNAIVFNGTAGKEFHLVHGERTLQFIPEREREPPHLTLDFAAVLGLEPLWSLNEEDIPIVNTSHRFGATIRVWYSRPRWTYFAIGRLLPSRLGLIVSGLHDSGYLSSEIAHRIHTVDPGKPVTPVVSISAHMWQIAVLLAYDELGSNSRGAFTFAAGTTGLLSPARGYYTLENPPGESFFEDYGRGTPDFRVKYAPVTTGVAPEPYFSLEAANPDWKWLVPERWRWAWFVSADLRFRWVYDYGMYDSESEDLVGTSAEAYVDAYRAANPLHRKPSLNLLVGWWNTEKPFRADGSLQYYLRFYYGANPFGQLRNDDQFFMIGLGVAVN